MHILCIEDGPGEARLMEKHLLRAGYAVTLASDGETGLAQQEQAPFDVVLVDLNLPGISGLDVLQTLLVRNALLPVIVVTGRGDEETAVVAMKLGARDYIVKDVQGVFMNLLPAVVEQVLRQQRLILEKQYAEAVTRRREAILESVAFAAEKLLQTPTWKSHIDDILSRLGQVMDVSRIYLAENGKTADGHFIIKHCREWIAEGVEHRTMTCMGKSYEEIGIGAWIPLFEQRQPVYGSVADMPDFAQLVLSKHHVYSMAIVPIFTGSSWWGIIGFDCCYPNRTWESAEIDALRTAANILGAALQRQLTEGALYQAQKLESLGLLVGGIAHDFNNLLTAILGQTSLSLFKLPADSSARSNIIQVIQTTEQATLLVQQLLGYAGKGKYQVQALNLNALIEENVALLETILRKQTRLTLNLLPELPAIDADRSQMQQIIMNLIINAAEAAVGTHGEVQVMTRLVTLDTAVAGLAQDAPPPGSYVCLDVIDNGQGIDPIIMNQIFDPFFSTKASGRGLGLSAVLGIIQSHGGTLQVESAVGQGSHFRIFLPVSDQSAVMAKKESLFGGQINGCILLIDDEYMVRQSVKDALESVGATVVTAENGPTGIELYRQHHETIDLIVLDMQMPGLNGRQTFTFLKNINPHVKVILSSGYGEAEAIQEFTRQDILSFLQKPYRFEKLVAEVQAALYAA